MTFADSIGPKMITLTCVCGYEAEALDQDEARTLTLSHLFEHPDAHVTRDPEP